MCETPRPKPRAPSSTRTGCVAVTLLPFPICPKVLSPQHHSSSLRVRAQTCANPPPSSTASERFSTRCGPVAGCTLPTPSCPEWFAPQHHTDPSPRSAHA
ncbi:MAG: hypothetical protein R3A52_14950 [Polyangiales bacterium]